MASDEHERDLLAVAAGDVDALERLYRALRVPVFAVALAVTRDPAVAEDVAHDAFVRAWERAGTYRAGGNARGWLVAIARNLALDALRRREVTGTLERTGEDERLTGSVWVEALIGLDLVDRQIVVLHALAGFKHAEIATQLGLPAGTVRWRYRRALARLEGVVDG
jgi:RNA polymerase sigma factor (sigma-70 family)